MEMKFGKMTVTRCDKHTFLGTKLRFPGDGSVQINMREYIMEAIEVFNQPLTRSAATPAIDDLSKPLLDENMALALPDTPSLMLGVEELNAGIPNGMETRLRASGTPTSSQLHSDGDGTGTGGILRSRSLTPFERSVATRTIIDGVTGNNIGAGAGAGGIGNYDHIPADLDISTSNALLYMQSSPLASTVSDSGFKKFFRENAVLVGESPRAVGIHAPTPLNALGMGSCSNINSLNASQDHSFDIEANANLLLSSRSGGKSGIAGGYSLTEGDAEAIVSALKGSRSEDKQKNCNRMSINFFGEEEKLSHENNVTTKVAASTQPPKDPSSSSSVSRPPKLRRSGTNDAAEMLLVMGTPTSAAKEQEEGFFSSELPDTDGQESQGRTSAPSSSTRHARLTRANSGGSDDATTDSGSVRNKSSRSTVASPQSSDRYPKPGSRLTSTPPPALDGSSEPPKITTRTRGNNTRSTRMGVEKEKEKAATVSGEGDVKREVTPSLGHPDELDAVEAKMPSSNAPGSNASSPRGGCSPGIGMKRGRIALTINTELANQGVNGYSAPVAIAAAVEAQPVSEAKLFNEDSSNNSSSSSNSDNEKATKQQRKNSISALSALSEVSHVVQLSDRAPNQLTSNDGLFEYLVHNKDKDKAKETVSSQNQEHANKRVTRITKARK